jgi:phage terminase small subunit
MAGQLQPSIHKSVSRSDSRELSGLLCYHASISETVANLPTPPGWMSHNPQRLHREISQNLEAVGELTEIDNHQARI